MTSTNEKQFPRGAEWVRVDFHLHTNADKEFKYSGEANSYNSVYVDQLEKSGIRLGVITNHNKFDFEEFKSLRAASRKKNIGLLPGVELSVNDGANGIHTLVVFSDAWLENGQDYVNPFLTSVFEGKTPSQYEQENGRSSFSLVDTIKKLEVYNKDFFLVFAHVEQASGLWMELEGGRIIDLGENDFFRRRTLGFQKVRTHDGAGSGRPCRVLVQQWLKNYYPAEVEGSDPKNIDEIGRGKSSYLKLGELSFEAAKFALFDYTHRVRSELPEPRKAVLLQQVRFNGGALDGLSVPFSPSLNCLIGPRGNGKSAVIECLRHALGFREISDERYKSGLVERMLSPAGKVVVEAVDEFGRGIRIERERTGQPSVYLDGDYRDISPGSILKDILYFGQKDLSTRSESFDESFLDKLLADRLDPKPQEQAALVEGVRQAARQLKETLEATERIAALQKEKNELDAQLQVFTNKGVDKKLVDMTLFDGDRQSILAWQQALKELGSNLKESADWDEVNAAFPVLKSNRSEPIVADLSAAKAMSDDARTKALAALQTLRDAFAAVGESLQKLTPVQEEMKNEVAELQRTLNEPQLDLELFRKKKAQLDQLVKLLAAGAQRAKTEQTARDLLGSAVNNLHDFWRERFTEREAEVRRLEAELPVLTPERRGRRRRGGIGTTGRLTVQLAPPGEERRVVEPGVAGLDLLAHRGLALVGRDGVGGPQDAAVGPVAQGQQGDGLPRLGPVEHVGQHDAAVGGAGVADHRGQVVDGGAEAAGGTRVHAGHDEVIDLGELGPLEGVGEGGLGQGHVGHLAEALLPLPGRGLARDAPAVEELRRRRCSGQRLADDAVLAEHEGSGAVTAVTLVGPAGQAGAHVGQHHEGVTGLCPESHGAGTRTHGAAHVVGRHLFGQAEGGVDSGGVGLVQVGRVGGGEEHLVEVRLGDGSGRLHPHRGGVLVVGRHGPGALAAEAAEGFADAGPFEAEERDVCVVRSDAGHGQKLVPVYRPTPRSRASGRPRRRCP